MEMGVSLSMDFTKTMSVKIISVAKQLPKYTRPTKEIIPWVKLWMSGQEERFQRKVMKLFEGAGVDRRYSIMDAQEVFAKTSFEEKNEIYVREVTQLAEQSLIKSLEKAKLEPTEIDYIITVSCTGMMIPSVDAYVINSLGMRQDIVRLPVTEMGCAAGVSGIIFFTASKSLFLADSPVICPETKIASGIEENTTLLDLSATERLSSENANSALIL